MTITVVAYDPDWPLRFASERAALEQLLTPWLESGVHHIGSTAVPELAAKPITHHLHLTEPGSDLWRERLAFRDALRSDPALPDEYRALKLQLADAHDNIAGYTADKREFVAQVLASAGITLARALPS